MPVTPPVGAPHNRYTRFKYGSECAHIVKEQCGNHVLYVPQSVDSRARQSENLEEIMKVEGPTRPFRYDVYFRAHASAEDDERWVHAHHRIDTLALLAETRARCPQYIYRVVSDKSAGINQSEYFQSEAVKQKKRRIMEDMTEEYIAENLRHHMQRKKFPSHWISFTSDKGWAFHRAKKMKLENHENIRIAMVDTMKLVSQTQIFPAAALLEAFDVEKYLKPIRNRGGAEMLVWDELVAPGVLIPLEYFLRGLTIEDGRVVEGYSSLQPSHSKPLSTKHSIQDVLKAMGRSPARGLHAPCYLRFKNYKSDSDKHHEIRVRKAQAPKTWFWKYTPGRCFYGKKINNWWDKNARVPISRNTVCDFIKLVEENFPVEFQFPTLIALLSMRGYFFEYDSVLDMIEELREHDPMLNPHGKKYECYFRKYGSPELPELDAFETLLIECSKRCGLKITSLGEAPEQRDFRTMTTPHMGTMMFDMESEDRAKDALEKSIHANKRKQGLVEAEKPKITSNGMGNKRKLGVLDQTFGEMGWDDSMPSAPSKKAKIS